MAEYTAAEVQAAIAGLAATSPVVSEALDQLIKDLNSTGDFNEKSVVALDTAVDGANDASIAGASVVIMEGTAKINAAFAANDTVKMVVTASGVNDNSVTFNTDDDVTVMLGAGKGNSVVTAGGDDTVAFAGGTATINTGDGDDVVQILAIGDGTSQSAVQITMGDGDGVITLDTTYQGKATIDAGDGFDQLVVSLGKDGGFGEHTFDFVNGKFVMNSAGITMENVNVVVAGSYNPTTGMTDGEDAVVLAATEGDSLAARLYAVALGREESVLDDHNGWNGLRGEDAIRGDLGGIAYWMDVADQSNLQTMVYSFLDGAEFHNKTDWMDNEQYVNYLFNNLGNIAGKDIATVDGLTAADYIATLNGNPYLEGARFNVAWAVAKSDTATQILGVDGAQYVIDGDFTFTDPMA